MTVKVKKKGEMYFKLRSYVFCMKKILTIKIPNVYGHSTFRGSVTCREEDPSTRKADHPSAICFHDQYSVYMQRVVLVPGIRNFPVVGSS